MLKRDEKYKSSWYAYACYYKWLLYVLYVLTVLSFLPYELRQTISYKIATFAQSDQSSLRKHAYSNI